LSVYVPFKSIDPKRKHRHYWGEATEWANPGWKLVELAFSVPAQVKSAHLQFRFTGYGQVWIDDVSLRRVESKSKVGMALLPFSFIDNTFYLSQGQPGVLMLGVKNAGAKLKNPTLHLLLPEGIEYMDNISGNKNVVMRLQVEVDGQHYNEIVMRSWAPWLYSKSGYRPAYGHVVLAKTNLPATEKSHQGYFFFSDDNLTTDREHFTIKVIPAIRGKRPRRFETGAHVWNDIHFEEPQAVRDFTAFYGGCGFSMLHMNGALKQFAQPMKAAGIKRYAQELVVNGYSFRGKKVVEERFLGVDGNWVSHGTCPAAIYQKGRYLEEVFVPEARRLLAEADMVDHIMCNWEPFMYNLKGCFCTRCRDEFVRYSQEPAQTIAAAWPREIIRKYPQRWVRFRSWQHGKMLKTLEAIIGEIGRGVGKEPHFIPEISISHFSEDCEWGEYDVRDYLGKLPVIQPWGPYCFHRFASPYGYQRGKYLIWFSYMMRADAFVAARIPERRQRPRLLAFPMTQSADWVVEPECLAMETIASFVAGWGGCVQYFFPHGYDARYWRALANANSIIADNEDFVFSGTRVDEAEELALELETPVPAVSSKGKYFRPSMNWRAGGPSLVQAVEYRWQGRRLFAIGNFWEKGDVFVKLRPKSLPAGSRWVLHEAAFDRDFTNAAGKRELSAADLQQGVTVHVGAMRWAFFTLRPAAALAPAAARRIPPQLIAAIKTSFLPNIEEAMNFEKSYQAKREAQVTRPDVSKFTPLKSGKVSSVLEKKEDTEEQQIVFTTDRLQLAIDPFSAAKITRLQMDGISFSHKKKPLHFGAGALMMPTPTNIFNQPYAFLGQEKTKDGLRVNFKTVLLPQKYGYNIGGLELRKSITVFNDGRGFRVSTRLVNASDHAMTNVSYRYHNLLCLQNAAGKAIPWQANFAGADKEPVCFQVDGAGVEFFRFKPQIITQLEKYGEKRYVLSDPDFSISWPGARTHIRVSIPERERLYGYMFWGFPHQGVASSSAEPIYAPVNLDVGQSATASMVWRIE